MSGKRFTELINLYLDKEISDEEMAELERETAANAERRHLFLEYVRLENASTQLVERHGERLVESVDFKKYHMMARHSGWSLRRTVWVSTGAFAAACLTLVAAVRFMEDTIIGGPAADFTRAGSANWSTSVEVYQPSDAQALRGFSVPTRSASASSLQAAKAELTTRPVNWVDTARGVADASGFQVRVAVEDLKPAKAERVFRSTPVFQASPEFASFEFQR